MFQRSTVPYMSAGIEGIGGVLKASPEDFKVTEIPAYLPSGEGEHLFLHIQKKSVSADALFKHLSAVLHVDVRDIGTAGLKDTHAVTRQWVSVPATCAAYLSAVDTEGVQVLEHALHSNKLRTGHTKGNAFEITVTQVKPGSLPLAQAVLDTIRTHGFPNRYDSQRFGRNDSTLRDGLRMLTEQQAPVRLKGWQKRLCLSAVQSALFNEVLAKRMHDGLLHTVLAGDVMQVAASGGPFVVEDVERENIRYHARETVLTGPMFGPKMRSPQSVSFDRETEALASSGLQRSSFEGFGKLMLGTRRPMVVWPENLEMAYDETTLSCTLRFTLPPGAYASALAQEWIKG